MKKVILITSDTATGEVEIEAVGFKGQSCAQATAAYEKALGNVTATMKKPEYYSNAPVSTNQTIGGGK